MYTFYFALTDGIDWADLYLWAMISARLLCRHAIITLSVVNMNWGKWTSISREWLEHFYNFSVALISYIKDLSICSALIMNSWHAFQLEYFLGYMPIKWRGISTKTNSMYIFNVACRQTDVIFNDGIPKRSLPSCCRLKRFLLSKSLEPKENLVRTTETILSVHLTPLSFNCPGEKFWATASW